MTISRNANTLPRSPLIVWQWMLSAGWNATADRYTERRNAQPPGNQTTVFDRARRARVGDRVWCAGLALGSGRCAGEAAEVAPAAGGVRRPWHAVQRDRPERLDGAMGPARDVAPPAAGDSRGLGPLADPRRLARHVVGSAADELRHQRLPPRHLRVPLSVTRESRGRPRRRAGAQGSRSGARRHTVGIRPR